MGVAMRYIFKSSIFVKISVILLVVLIIGYSLYVYLPYNTDTLEISSKVVLIAFSPKNKIAVASRHRVELFDLKTRKIQETFDVLDDITAMQFSPDGYYLAFAIFGVLTIRPIEQGKKVNPWEIKRWGLDLSNSLSFSLDGKILAIGEIGSHGDARIHLSLVEEGEHVVKPIPGYSFALFSQDGNWLAAIPDWSRFRVKGCGIEMLRVEKIQGEYRIKCEKTLASNFNLFEGTLGALMRYRQVTSIAITSDAKILASIQKDDDYRIRIWSLESCKELDNVGGGDEVTSIAFSPDGKLLASAGEDGQIRLYSIETGCRLETKWTHSGKANCVAFSPDGKFLASGGNDCKVRFWEIPK